MEKDVQDAIDAMKGEVDSIKTSVKDLVGIVKPLSDKVKSTDDSLADTISKAVDKAVKDAVGETETEEQKAEREKQEKAAKANPEMAALTDSIKELKGTVEEMQAENRQKERENKALQQQIASNDHDKAVIKVLKDLGVEDDEAIEDVVTLHGKKFKQVDGVLVLHEKGKPVSDPDNPLQHYTAETWFSNHMEKRPSLYGKTEEDDNNNSYEIEGHDNPHKGVRRNSSKVTEIDVSDPERDWTKAEEEAFEAGTFVYVH